MTVTRPLDIIIISLWGLLIFGFFILASWQFGVNWINQVDDFFKDRYLVQLDARYEKLLSEYEQAGDNETAIREFERLLLDLEAVQQGDELFLRVKQK